ncbi:TlpA family protein disulfide reductase [Mucilaginibacter lutimaris]|uniref:TlpA family protein disulfide reductase n=1 Tax=Mucilaginibacter lutimaris TaxID=931629 RepID=A0ABW2ZIY1_9SPHI
MKHFYILAALVLLVCACDTQPKLSLSFKTGTVKNGTITLSMANETLISQPIKDGTATIDKPLEKPGYYTIAVIDSDKPLNTKQTFELYLENGAYTIETKSAGLYPSVTSASKIQQQLSDYYKTENAMAGSLNNAINSGLNFLESSEARNQSAKERSALINKTRGYQVQRRELEPKILDAYIAKHPNNVVAAHIMAQQYMDEFPAEYNKLAAKLTDEAKKTDDGLKVTDKLSVLVKLLPGADAPAISGVTSDGKPFNRKSIKFKAILVEFWVSNSKASEMNHSRILNGLIIGDRDKHKFGVVSVSTDTDEKVWKQTIKQSNLNWPQVADLKGNASPNVSNWKISQVPTYFLVDANWKIIKPNIDILDVDDVVHEYFNKH